MSYECPICKKDPTSHSLKIIHETDSCVFVYTKPADANLYYDTEGILKHYYGVLSQIPSTKSWEWIFDAKGFSLKHAMEITLATKMATMITDHFSHNLRSIRVIHPTMFVSITINTVWPFLTQSTRNVIKIEH